MWFYSNTYCCSSCYGYEFYDDPCRQGLITGLGGTVSGYSPYLSDTDWDGTLDAHDVVPWDYLKDSIANNGTTVQLNLEIGDPSGSHSERYALAVGPYRVHMPSCKQKLI